MRPRISYHSPPFNGTGWRLSMLSIAYVDQLETTAALSHLIHSLPTHCRESGI